MKPKVFNKKLSLSKKTIADIDNIDENRIYGGFQKTREAQCFSYDHYTQCFLSWCGTICGGPNC